MLVITGHVNVLDANAEGEFFYGEIGFSRRGFCRNNFFSGAQAPNPAIPKQTCPQR
jgi:hypothetical protein